MNTWKQRWQETLLILCLYISLSGCQPRPSSPPPVTRQVEWSYADLRWIDPADAPEPSFDMLAAYLNLDAFDLHIRLDLLDLPELPDQDLYLLIDSQPGGGGELPVEAQPRLEWDLLLQIPADGQLQAAYSDGEAALSIHRAGIGARVMRDPRQDTILISLQRSALPGLETRFSDLQQLGVEIFLAQSGTNLPVDRIGPIQFNAPPPAPGEGILVFWNAFSAYTPLQAGRRWDGAHTGPFGGRHGLLHLLQAARASDTPIFLLDLLTPQSLAALESVAGLEMVRQMQASGLLGLSLPLPGFAERSDAGLAENIPPAWVVERSLAEYRATSAAFGLRDPGLRFALGGEATLANLTPTNPGGWVFLPGGQAQAENGLALIWPENRAGWKSLALPGLPGPEQAIQQAAGDGPTLPVRRALIAAALANAGNEAGSGPLVVLGGDLPSSAWGSPAAARASLRYLQNHPWIRILGPADLAGRFPSRRADPLQGGTIRPEVEPDWLETLRQAPENGPAAGAWLAYQASFAPVFPFSTNLAELRSVYSRATPAWLAAAAWAEQASQQAGCEQDFDGDGEMECILASEQVFAIFKLARGGGLAWLFVRDSQGEVHQVVAPSSQWISGTSPAETWNLAAGLWADPASMPGAFFSPTEDDAVIADLAAGQIRLAIPGSPEVKSFRLVEAGLEARLEGQAAPPGLAIQLDPWLRLAPGGINSDRSSPETSEWRLSARSAELVVRSNLALSVLDWSLEKDRLLRPEDPNQDTPAGFWLPFSITLLEPSSSQTWEVTIQLHERAP
jgi:hypothetical protein